jgi:BolA protein
MSVQSSIQDKLEHAVAPQALEVVNESDSHNVPPGSESHFRVTVVTGAFEGLGLLARHRRIHQLLEDELAGPVHALALHTYTPEEWQARQGSPASPPCLGGGAR